MDSQPNKIAIVTGVSRGIGRAIVYQLLNEGFRVIGLGRKNLDENIHNFIFIQVDLSNQSELEQLILPELTGSQLAVINNAGMLGEVNLTGFVNQSSIFQAFNLNIIAPIIITNKILERFKNSFKTINLLYISSGAALRPIAGWSTYCASKAALNHYCLTVIEDLRASGTHNVTVHYISPGVVDTQMQAEIRQSNATIFPEHQHFVNLFSEKKLRDVSWVAQKIIKIIHQPQTIKQGLVKLDEI